MENDVKKLEGLIYEVLENMQTFSTHVDERFTRIESTAAATKHDFEKRFAKIESTMVTRDYLDEKLADLRDDLVVLARKGNTKLSVLIEELVAQKSLKRDVANNILALEPFPHS